MDYLKSLKIAYKGLSNGDHKFSWKLDKSFFELIGNTEIISNHLQVNLELEKQERMMILNFTIVGEVTVACDRCLDDLKIPLDRKTVLYVKFGKEWLEEDENVLILPETDYELNISDLINEYVTLAIPLKKVHGNDAKGNSLCNKEVTDKLRTLSEEQPIDPRWEKLKNLNLE